MLDFFSSYFSRLPKALYFIYLIITVASIGFVLMNHYNLRDEKLYKNAENANKTLDASFDNAESLLKLIANSIADNNSPRYIETVIAGLQPDEKNKQLASWNYVSWITPRGMISITSRTGILTNPVPVNRNRPTITSALQTPGRLFIGKPDYGIISGQMILPTTFGIADRKGKIIGALHMTFMVSSVEDKIQSAIDREFKFIIIDKHSKHAIFSSDKVRNISFSDKETTANGAVYRIIKASDRYPFAIVIGYISRLDNQILFEKLIGVVSTLLIIGFLCLAGLSFFYRKAILPLRQLTESADITIEETAIDSKSSFPEVQKLADKLSAIMISHAEQEKSYKFAKAEGRAAQNSIAAITEILLEYKQTPILTFSNGDDDISPVDIEKLLRGCLNIYSYHAFKHKIETHLSVSSNSTFNSDSFKLKQIFSSFIAYAMREGKDNDRLTIMAKTALLYGNTYLFVSIGDNGINIDNGLGVGEINIDKILEDAKSNFFDHGLINSIRLIKHLNGYLSIESILGKGTEYTVFIPQSAIKGQNNNVINFAHKKKFRGLTD